MVDLILLLASCMVLATVVSAAEYYRHLRGAQKEYEKAKRAVEDMLLSFNRQFQRGDQKLETLGYRIEAVASRDNTTSSLIEDVGRRVGSIEVKIGAEVEGRERITTRLDGLEKSIRDITASQDAATARLASLEQQARQFPLVPEAGLEAVIPIRREKAMAQLTETEVSVLVMLSSEGPRTAPEIKEKVRLSREHTARLMKNLYEEGYLERDTSKIPFKYSVKKEMEKLLKRADNQTT